MKNILKIIKEERANSLVENVIILPLIFIIVFLMIMSCFALHDRSTLDSAAKRGMIYAAHCISDPNYKRILNNSGNTPGSLDIDENVSSFSFDGAGNNIQPYRYLRSTTPNLKENVEQEVRDIIDKTRIPWNEINVSNITFEQVNKMFYQNVSIKLTAKYPLPKFFEAFGLPEGLTYEVVSKMSVNDPDEFIRNADLAVDILSSIDDATGNHLSKAKEKIEVLGDKIIDWLG